MRKPMSVWFQILDWPTALFRSANSRPKKPSGYYGRTTRHESSLTSLTSNQTTWPPPHWVRSTGHSSNGSPKPPHQTTITTKRTIRKEFLATGDPISNATRRYSDSIRRLAGKFTCTRRQALAQEAQRSNRRGAVQPTCGRKEYSGFLWRDGVAV
jgi:hypothetical protein